MKDHNKESEHYSNKNLSIHLKNAFTKNNGILTFTQAKSLNISETELLEAYKNKNILQEEPGIFMENESDYDDMYILQLLHPTGVYSHETAVMLHNLSRFSPFRDYMIVPENYDTEQLNQNNVVTFQTTESYFPTENATVKNFLGNNVTITNLERTVIDMLSSTHSMGDVVKEVIESYLDEEQKNIERLTKYASLFNLENTVQDQILNRLFPKN
ncbi:type IV toxin-antitoxin system AbiEi family antitoxin domain-containing protein [Marinilactibacillus kalidii]|uniref:type IV toxin-antitoxin system AbiEi family antitoxin domain-containing protein n=1 Tax=Marinilactibacillus kalidii TaxID=2820274 RepID=UPI001ABDEB95|nr:hypothetical protein [Marinilactibacillus kalidii]